MDKIAIIIGLLVLVSSAYIVYLVLVNCKRRTSDEISELEDLKVAYENLLRHIRKKGASATDVGMLKEDIRDIQQEIDCLKASV